MEMLSISVWMILVPWLVLNSWALPQPKKLLAQIIVPASSYGVTVLLGESENSWEMLTLETTDNIYCYYY